MWFNAHFLCCFWKVDSFWGGAWYQKLDNTDLDWLYIAPSVFFFFEGGGCIDHNGSLLSPDRHSISRLFNIICFSPSPPIRVAPKFPPKTTAGSRFVFFDGIDHDGSLLASDRHSISERLKIICLAPITAGAKCLRKTTPENFFLCSFFRCGIDYIWSISRARLLLHFRPVFFFYITLC